MRLRYVHDPRPCWFTLCLKEFMGWSNGQRVVVRGSHKSVLVENNSQ